jgi:hypothetical protein
MVRNLERRAPMTRLRVWAGQERPDGQPPAATDVVVEWAGRTGHPTSYALLGAQRSGPKSTISVQRGDIYAEALAGRNDTVYSGLLDSYEDAVLEVIAESTSPITVSTAAHGLVGSSPMAFRRVAAFLVRLLELNVEALSDAELWEAWDRAGGEFTPSPPEV